MLSTLLSNLVSYFSKYFLVASFFPMLAFWFLSGLMGYLLLKPFHDWVAVDVLKSGAMHAGFVSTALVLGIVMSALGLASINDSLRGLLEGTGSGPVLGGLRLALVPIEERRLRRIEGKIAAAAQAQLDLGSATTQWISKLRTARRLGITDHPNVNTFQGNENVVRKLEDFRRLRTRNRIIPHAELEVAVGELEGFLRVNDARVMTGRRPRLGECHGELIQLIQYAAD